MAVSVYNPIGGSGNRNGGKGAPGKYGDYGKVHDIAKKNEIIAPIKKDIQPVAPKTEYIYVNSTPEPAPSSGGHSGGDSTVDYIKQKLKEQEEALKASFKAQYDQELLQNTNDWERNRNQANRNYKRADRFLRGLYGNQVTGKGLSSRASAYSSWNNILSDYLQNKTKADATSLSTYNQKLANAGNTLAQGWYNYVLPYYTNKAIQQDNHSYRMFLAGL